jgi:hypothetical protein
VTYRDTEPDLEPEGADRYAAHKAGARAWGREPLPWGEWVRAGFPVSEPPECSVDDDDPGAADAREGWFTAVEMLR